MKNTYFKSYKNFKCIAATCPDSCCKDWDVVVDDKSQSFYENVGGEFGRKLKELTTIDGDGDRIFISHNGKCPFWNNQKLCDIYIELGEEHLCDTCRKFPRLTQDYTTFAEHMLSFACPEAAKIMLSDNTAFDIVEEVTTTNAQADYNTDFMEFLLKTRQKTLEIITDTDTAFNRRLQKCLTYNQKIQNLIGNENFNADNCNFADCEFKNNAENIDCMFVFELYKKLDIMSDKWRTIIEKATQNYRSHIGNNVTDKNFTALAIYYIYRYYLSAIDSYDVMATIKRIACAYIVLSCAEFGDSENSFDSTVMLFQLYSKEVEHSYENNEILDGEFFTNPEFSTDNLIGALDF